MLHRSNRTVSYTVLIPEGSDCSLASDYDDLYSSNNNILVYDSESEVSEINDDVLIIKDSDEEPDDYDDTPLYVRLENIRNHPVLSSTKANKKTKSN